MFSEGCESSFLCLLLPLFLVEEPLLAELAEGERLSFLRVLRGGEPLLRLFLADLGVRERERERRLRGERERERVRLLFLRDFLGERELECFLFFLFFLPVAGEREREREADCLLPPPLVLGGGVPPLVTREREVERGGVLMRILDRILDLELLTESASEGSLLSVTI
jgi:hypothetical protein